MMKTLPKKGGTVWDLAILPTFHLPKKGDFILSVDQNAEGNLGGNAEALNVNRLARQAKIAANGLEVTFTRRKW
ncbi:MAG: hypothetical protein CM15mP2_0610 [Methanobacteriota archaeon]|nr:MAG: hypothetical protein CM15mP2_0610 [Euryarchaeota archaeon]